MGLWERMGRQCRKSKRDNEIGFWDTPSSGSHKYGILFQQASYYIQHCYLLHSWLLWSSRCPWFTRYWRPGLHYTTIDLLSPQVHLKTLALLTSHLYLTGCLYSGSSKSFRGGNVTKNQAARLKHEAQDSCGKLCKVLKISEEIKMIEIIDSCFHDVCRSLASYQMLEGQHAIRKWSLY